jgi:titin
MTRLLLIDSRVSDIASIGDSLTEDTEMMVFDYDTDTVESLQSKITKNYESVSIAQHNYFLPTCKLLDSMEDSTLLSVETRDPQLQTWQSLVGFFTWLKDERGAQYIDLLACDLWGSPDWYYVIQTIRTTYNVWIRASINITGEGGDFILESDNVNLIGIYFTESISTYRYAFYNTQTAGSAPHFAWNPQINLPMNGGKVSVTNYVTLVGSMLNCSSGAAGYTYINPPGDMSNVVNMWSNQNYDVPSSYACLTASGQVITFGINKVGGDSSGNTLALASDVVKVVPSVQGYAALKVDGTVVSWGSAADVPLTATGNSTIVPTSAVDLTGCTDVVASGNTFAGLKTNGTVVMWGFVGTWGLPTASDLSDVIKIKESLGYPSYSFIALRSDGHVVMWGPGGTARSSTAGLTSTSPIVDVYPNDYGFVIVRADGTVYKGLTNTITYTIPADRTIMRVVPTSTYEFAIMFDNNSMYLTNTSTLITDVTEITVNDGPSYAYIQNGAVICGGDTRYGGSAVNATYGIQSGISVTSGVIKLAATAYSIAALKSNGTVAVWGIGNGGIYYSGVVQSMLTNVVDLIAVRDGYFAITSANKIISWGSTSNKWNGTPTTTFQNNISYTAGKTVSLCTSLSSSVFVESSANVILSPNTVTQYDRNTITYESNVQYRKAIKGRTYGFYYRETQLSTFTPSEDTYTYTFPNTSIPVSGNVLCSIHDITSYTSNTFPVDASINVSVIYNPVGPNPDPPSINGVIAGRSKLTILATPSNLTQGVASTNYKYSLDGTNYITYPNQTVVSSVTTSYSPALSVGGTTTMMRIFVHSGGQLLYVTDPVANRFYTSTFNGSTWSAFSTISSFTFQSASSIDMNSDCTRGVFAPSAAGSKCFYFTNAFSTPVQIQDNVARTYKAAAISGDGKTMAVIADKVYYTKWNDASQNFGILSVANNDTATTNALAISSDGLMLAYLNGLAVYVATWNGSNYSEGTFISNLPTDSGSYGSNCIRFSTNDNILFASSIKASSAPSASHFIYYSCWNGSTFTTFTAYDSFAGASAFLWGIGLDSTNSIYSILYGKTPIYRFNTSITTTTVAKPTVLTLTSGITAGNPYTVSLKMTNAFGDSTAVTASSAVTPYDLPGAPILNSVTGGNGQITFTYSAGNTNGSAITNYYYSINGGSTYVSMGSTSGSYTISSGLVNGTRYYLRLKAYNEAGLSTAYAIDASGAVPYTVPGTPTITSAVGATGQITVNFTAPASNGGTAITGYNYSTDNGTSYTFRASTTSPIVITGLNNGATYYVKLQAVNPAGSSTATSASTVTLSNSVPSAPVITTVTPGNTRATVAFTAPNNGGLAITAYYYSYNGGSNYYSTGSTNTSFDVSGLTNGTSYTFLMKAQNSLGNSVASSASASVVPRTVPGTPTINDVVSGNQQLTVTFTAPASNGGNAITGYQYSVNGGVSYSEAGLTSPFVISGLTNGVSYAVQLRAVNAAGNSSDASFTGVVPCTIPDTPTINTVTPGDGELSVAFSEPANGGSAITNYYYSINSGVSYTYVNNSTNPFTISGLTNGTAYRVQMLATNVVGNSVASSESVSSTPRTVPSTPSITSYVEGNQEVSFSFSLPSNGGSDITDMQYKIGTGSYVSMGIVTTYTVSSLSNGTAHTIVIRAVNAAGNSSDSSSITVTPRTVPDAPTITSSALGNQQLTVAFSAPAWNGGSAITGYFYSLNDGSLNACSEPSVTISSLTNGSSYTVNVYAVNVAGYSVASNTVTLVPRTVPDAPTIDDATPGNATAQFSFSPPASNGGDAITSYQYAVNDGSYVTIATDASPYTITGLTNGSSYTIWLRAVNGAGYSASAYYASNVVPYTVPDQPVITAMDPSNGALVVHYSGFNGGRSLNNVFYSLDGGSFVSSGNSGANPLVISSLTNGTSYSVAIKVANIEGNSSASDASSAIPYTMADSPILTSVVDGAQECYVHFDEGANNGGTPVTSYTYSFRESATETEVMSGSLATTSTLHFTGLDVYVEYQLQIVAVNLAGNSLPLTVNLTGKNVPSAPTIQYVTAAYVSAEIYYTDGSDNASTVTKYQYSVNGGAFVDISSAYPLVIPSLSPDVSSTLAIRSVNAIGSSATSNEVSVVPYTLPDPPIIDNVTAGNGSVRVRFTPGASHSSTIRTYKYSLSEGDWIDASSVTSPLFITGLTNGTSYTVRLIQTNAAGDSNPSLASVSFIPYTVPDAPGAPSITSAVAGVKSAQIYFTNGTNTGPEILGYKYSVTEGGTYFYAVGTSNPIQVPNLENGVEYTFRLVAFNAGGDSSPSVETVQVTPYDVPGTPIILDVAVSSESMTVIIVPSAANGAPSLQYWYSLNDASFVPISLGAGGNTIAINGLTNGMSYSVKVKAISVYGSSAISNISYDNIPYREPDAPTITSVTEISNGVSVAFTDGSSNGYDILGYQYSIDNGATYWYASGTTSPIVIAGLTNGTSYTVRLKSFTAKNASSSSAPSSTFVPYDLPDAPTIIDVWSESGRMHVQFVDGRLNGRGLIQYLYSIDEGTTYNIATDVSQNIMTIQGLTNGTVYSVSMKTETSAGFSNVSNTYANIVPSALPSSPTITNVTIGNQMAYIYFDANSGNGAEITHYAYAINSATSFEWASSTSSPLVITGLVNGNTYTVRIKSYSNRGFSEESSPSESFRPCTLPNPPIITSVSVANESLSVSFTSGGSNGRSITSYLYSLNENEYVSAPDLSNPLVIVGLTNGVGYTISMKSVTEEGESVASTTTIAYTPSSVPDTPSIESVAPGNQQIQVVINEANLRGGALVGYKYRLNDSSDNVWFKTDTSPFWIDGVTNGITYTVRILAVTTAGESSLSAASESVVPYAMQAPPVITKVDAGVTSATVTFVDGEANGLSITGYKYSLDNGDSYSGLVEASNNRLFLSGLVNGNSYQVRIKSVSTKGDSEASNLSAAFVPYTRPDAPTVTTVTPFNQSMRVTFTQGSLGGTDFIGYKYVINTDETEKWATQSPLTVLELTNGTSYSIKMKTVTKGGESDFTSFSTEVVPYVLSPDAPTITGVTPSANSAIVSFTPGADNGATVYNYEYSLNGGAFNVCSVNANAFTVFGLSNDVSYSVRLKSFSNYGYSAVSASSETFLPFTVPDAPTITSVTAGNGNVMVSIVDGSNNGRSIEGYYYALNGSSVYRPCIQTTSPVTITDLSNNVSYAVSIKSYNVAGQSSASLISPIFTPFTNASAPSVSSVMEGNQSVTVFVANGDLNGSTVIGYRYSFDQTSWQSINTSANTFTIGGLTNGTTYVLYVKTVTNAGDSSVSSASSPFVPRNVPSAPTISNVVSGDDMLSVYFTAGSDNGSAILSYQYAVNSGSGYGTYVTAFETESPLTVYNVTNATAYTVRIRAMNVAGVSVATEWNESVTPYSYPSTPVITKIYPGTRSARVYFANVNANGAPITTYRYSVGSDFIDVSGLTSPLTIPGLTNKEPYMISICAKNQGGESRPSNMMSVIPGTPEPPTITDMISGPKSLTIHFTQPACDDPVTGFYYKHVGGTLGYIKLTGMTSPITIPKLANGLPYLIHLKSINVNGFSLESNTYGPVVPCEPPNKITFSVVPDIGKAYINLGSVIANGSSVTKYKYTLNPNHTLYDVSGLNNPLTIPDLSNNVPYTITMYAENRAGMSPASAVSPVFKCIFLPPPAISVVTLTAGLNRLTMAFKAPVTSVKTPILTYLYSINDGSYVNALSASTTIVVTGLANNTNYTARVIAVNAAGQSPPSPIITKPVKYLYDVTNAPTIKSVVTGFESATVAFGAPTSINNSPVVKYQYTLDAGITVVDVSGLVSPFTITDLSNNVTRTVQLRTVNGVGMSVWSALSKPFIHVYAATSAPTITNVLAGLESVTVAFTPPTSINNSPVVKYQYTLNAGTTIVDASGLVSPLTITGLSNNVTRSMQLRAVNGVGPSTWSALSKPFTYVYTAPSVPVVGTIASTSGGNITIPVTPPLANGSPITDYAYKLNNGSYVSAGTTLPIRIYGLAPGTYTVVVVATNAVGTSANSVAKTFISN